MQTPPPLARSSFVTFGLEETLRSNGVPKRHSPRLSCFGVSAESCSVSLAHPLAITPTKVGISWQHSVVRPTTDPGTPVTSGLLHCSIARRA
jgi:hypothetical protein